MGLNLKNQEVERLAAEVAALVGETKTEAIRWREAVDAYERFGRGRHAVRLNFGDCLSYATAKLAAQPLLYIGDDFNKTDIEKA